MINFHHLNGDRRGYDRRLELSVMSYIQVYLDDAGNIIGLEHCNLAQDIQLANITLVTQADIERSKY